MSDPGLLDPIPTDAGSGIRNAGMSELGQQASTVTKAAASFRGSQRRLSVVERGGGASRMLSDLEAVEAKLDGLDKKMEQIAGAVGAQTGPLVRRGQREPSLLEIQPCMSDFYSGGIRKTFIREAWDRSPSRGSRWVYWLWMFAEGGEMHSLQ